VFSRPVNLDQEIQHSQIPVPTDGSVGTHNTLAVDVCMQAAAQHATAVDLIVQGIYMTSRDGYTVHATELYQQQSTCIQEDVLPVR
jgi:hypothetical protein